MPQVDIGEATATDQTNIIEDYDVQSETTDGPTGDSEFRYTNTHFNEWFGYYKKIPELKIAVDTKANWVVGNGYTAEDDLTIVLLDTIKGNGKDTFNSILENMERTSYIAEDAFAEVIRNEQGVLINLKILDPGTMTVVTNKKGMILRYEQGSKGKKPDMTFKPEEIFVLSHNKTADEVHGESIIPAMEEVILARNEAITDWRKVLHRNVKPLVIWHVDTDDTAEIAKFRTMIDDAGKDGENIIIPKGAVEPEIITPITNAAQSPITWIENLTDYFFQAVGVPQVMVGNAKGFTDASAKIVYLAFEQRIKGRQLYVEEQILAQLNLEIKLTFPASLQGDTVSDTTSEVEEEPIEDAAQTNDVQETLPGKT